MSTDIDYSKVKAKDIADANAATKLVQPLFSNETRTKDNHTEWNKLLYSLCAEAFDSKPDDLRSKQGIKLRTVLSENNALKWVIQAWKQGGVKPLSSAPYNILTSFWRSRGKEDACKYKWLESACIVLRSANASSGKPAGKRKAGGSQTAPPYKHSREEMDVTVLGKTHLRPFARKHGEEFVRGTTLILGKPDSSKTCTVMALIKAINMTREESDGIDLLLAISKLRILADELNRDALHSEIEQSPLWSDKNIAERSSAVVLAQSISSTSLLPIEHTQSGQQIAEMLMTPNDFTKPKIIYAEDADLRSGTGNGRTGTGSTVGWLHDAQSMQPFHDGLMKSSTNGIFICAHKTSPALSDITPKTLHVRNVLLFFSEQATEKYITECLGDPNQHGTVAQYMVSKMTLPEYSKLVERLTRSTGSDCVGEYWGMIYLANQNKTVLFNDSVGQFNGNMITEQRQKSDDTYEIFELLQKQGAFETGDVVSTEHGNSPTPTTTEAKPDEYEEDSSDMDE